MNWSKLPAVPFSVVLLVIAALVALGVIRPWQQQEIAAVTPTTTDTPTPAATATSTATPTATPTVTNTPAPTPTPLIYVVQPNDTLLAIAGQYDTTVKALMEANNLRTRDLIYPGQELVIVTPAPTTETPTPEPTRFLTHIVKAGENLTSIATNYGTTVEALMTVNHLEDPRSLRAGQELLIPLASSVGGPGPVSGTLTASPRVTEVIVHVVQPGEGLLGIALKYHTSVEAIMAANNLADAQWILAGQELLIPLGTPTPIPTPTPRPTPTPTPGPPYAAPALLDPAEGEVFRGEEANIVLNWTSVGLLAEDEWYILRLRLMTEPVYQYPSVWTKTTSWRVPASLHPPMEAGSHLFRWDVTVVRHTGTRPDGNPDGIAISPMSAIRSFLWY